MRIEISRIDDVLTLLSRAFWSGKRWIAFPVSDALLQVKIVRFYTCFIHANRFCAARSRRGRIFRFKAIADIMKELKISRERICFFPSPANQYFPIAWNTYDGWIVNIVRWDERTKQFNFYDGRLRKSLPGKAIGIVDTRFFAFDEIVKFVRFND